MKRLAVAFTGESNSGKTTLIVKIANSLIKDGNQVIIIKNDPKDKAIFDVKGKDSYKFFETGAEVVVASPKRTTSFSHKSKSIDDIILKLDDFDFLLVEGLKNVPLPRICIFRNSNVNGDYFDMSSAVAIDETIDKNTIPNNLKILNLNSPEEIIVWIKQNAKEV